MADNIYKAGQYIIYMNGNRTEIGRIKRITDNGVFAFYSEGDTAAKTPFDRMWPIINDYVIQTTSLGGERDMAAQELLKAQEPHVMTKRDFENNPMVDENGSLPAFVEYREMNGIARPVDGWGVINRPWVDGYNDRRFWTSRPTDEQMEATPWL